MPGSTTAHSLPSKRRVLVATLAALLMALVALTAPGSRWCGRRAPDSQEGEADRRPRARSMGGRLGVEQGRGASATSRLPGACATQPVARPAGRLRLRGRASCPPSPGPIVLVGHSYGGAVITNAATGDPDVKALVYVNAFAPDEGETVLPARRRRLRTRSGPDHGVRLRPLPRRAGRRRGPLPAAAGLPDLVRQPGTRPRGSAPLCHATPHRVQRAAASPQASLRGRRSRPGTSWARATGSSPRPPRRRWPSAPGRRSAGSRPGTCP